MSYTVNVTDAADNDLRAIFSYIAFELKSYQNAAGQLERLESAICSLSEMPESYRRYEKEPWHSRGLRCMSVDNYCVFYIPDHARQTVEVIRVMYGGRDIDRRLEEFANETE